jgi:hypothetical protein
VALDRQWEAVERDAGRTEQGDFEVSHCDTSL